MDSKTKIGVYLEINTNHNNHLTFSRFWKSKNVCLFDKSVDTRSHKQKEMRFQIQNRFTKKSLEMIFRKKLDNTMSFKNAHRKVMKHKIFLMEDVVKTNCYKQTFEKRETTFLKQTKLTKIK